MVEFKGTVQLEAWLTDQPREVSVAIAARAVLRAVDIFYEEFEGSDLKSPGPVDKIVLEFFRTSALTWSSIGGHHRTEALAAAHNLSSSALFGSVVNTGTADVVRAAEFAFSTAAAAAAAAAGSPVDEVEVADFAVSTVITIMAARKADAPSAARLIWRAISQDVTAIENGMGAVALAQSPLNLPQKVTRWREFADFLTRRDPNWRFWVDWYEARLAGHPPSRRFERALLSLTEKEWEADARTVNALLMERMKDPRASEEQGLAFSVFERIQDKLHGRRYPLPLVKKRELASRFHVELRRLLTNYQTQIEKYGEDHPVAGPILMDIRAVISSVGENIDQFDPAAASLQKSTLNVAMQDLQDDEAKNYQLPGRLSRRLEPIIEALDKVLAAYHEDLHKIDLEAAARKIRPDQFVNELAMSKEIDQFLSLSPRVDQTARDHFAEAIPVIVRLQKALDRERDRTAQLERERHISIELGRQRLKIENLKRAAKKSAEEEKVSHTEKDGTDSEKGAFRRIPEETKTAFARKTGEQIAEGLGKSFQSLWTNLLEIIQQYSGVFFS